MKFSRIVVIAAILFGNSALAGDISGFWKHTEEPGWIEINLEEGKGTVVRNDKFPDRVGREILKDLEEDTSKQGLWTGQIFAEKLGEYKNAEITLAEPDLMTIKVKVGFIRRTVEWRRTEAVPLEPAS